MLIDTHTHFDLPVYRADFDAYIARATSANVRHLILIGYKARHFGRMVDTAAAMQNTPIHAHLAMGLHPLYIQSHTEKDLVYLDTCLKKHQNIAIGEIGLDTYKTDLGNIEALDKQKQFFAAQLTLAKTYNLPILLHIRKAHADTLTLIKAHKFSGGGIAHSFSSGEQEALAFIKLGFKLGLTGQLTNPNAKKLHRTVKTVLDKVGLSAFVVETDCPDMTPKPCQHLPINEPTTLPHVADTLATLANKDRDEVYATLWQNSKEALNYDFCL